MIKINHNEHYFSGKILSLLSECLSNIQGRMMHPSYVYILASQCNATLYVGSTLDIIKRTSEYQNKVIPGLTATYKVHMLVYYEMHELYMEAARREKRVKNGPRQWKIHLMEKLNPEWRHL